jgi:hypothetical protein
LRTLMIADASFAAHEADMLGRLEIGLADEGIRVYTALPGGTDVPEPIGRTSVTLEYDRTPLPFAWRLAVRPMLSRLQEALGEGEVGLDVVHVFGGSAWRFGAEIARATGAGLALEVWRTGLIDRVPAIKRIAASPVDGGEDAARDGIDVVLLAPDRVVQRALDDADSGVPTRYAPWGVHASAEPRRVLRPGVVPGVVLAGGGHDAAHARAALDACAGVIAQGRSIMVFADAGMSARAGLWKRASELGILSRFSLLQDIEARRELALRADLLLHPEARGERRTLLLDAMAAGLPIIAASDPSADELIDNRTARLVREPSIDAWFNAVMGLLDDAEAARALGRSARDHVREHHRASTHIAAVIDAYEGLSAPDPLPIGSAS